MAWSIGSQSSFEFGQQQGRATNLGSGHPVSRHTTLLTGHPHPNLTCSCKPQRLTVHGGGKKVGQGLSA